MTLNHRCGRNVTWMYLGFWFACLFACPGCQSTPLHRHQPVALAEFGDGAFARELEKETLPPYVIEPPDVLLIEAVKIVPKPPFKLQPLDVILVIVRETLPEAPITGTYGIDSDGMIQLGPEYGSVSVTGLTLPEAREAIETHLKGILAEPLVAVELAQTHGLQQINGEHLVRIDGTVGLGSYGSIRLAGLTLDDAKIVIEEQLSARLLNPEVFVDVVELNSKVCYVITDGAGHGEQIARFPITGNETVLDVVSQINGLPAVSSKHRIWVARPTMPDVHCKHVLAVDWIGITQRGSTVTNYQVLPGDRIYIHSDPMVAFANFVDKVTAPFERLFGFTLLGSSTIQELKNPGTNGGGGGGIGP